MQNSVKGRIRKVRDEIEQISPANREYMQSRNKASGAADHQRRLERLQAILDEVTKLTDWKKV
jgi:methyl-accepting chemotaxis protein